MKSGPSRVNAPLGDLRFQDPGGTFTASREGKQCRHQTDNSRAQVGQHAKEEVGVEGAHREWCSVKGKGDREQMWVFAWCLREGQV